MWSNLLGRLKGLWFLELGLDFLGGCGSSFGGGLFLVGVGWSYGIL